jgi:hypothetical protein
MFSSGGLKIPGQNPSKCKIPNGGPPRSQVGNHAHGKIPTVHHQDPNAMSHLIPSMGTPTFQGNFYPSEEVFLNMHWLCSAKTKWAKPETATQTEGRPQLRPRTRRQPEIRNGLARRELILVVAFCVFEHAICLRSPRTRGI